MKLKLLVEMELEYAEEDIDVEEFEIHKKGNFEKTKSEIATSFEDDGFINVVVKDLKVEL